MQVEAIIDITEVEAPQVRDAAQPISQRASMYVQGSSRSVVAVAAFQVVAQCVYQFVVLRGVISDQRPVRRRPTLPGDWPS